MDASSGRKAHFRFTVEYVNGGVREFDGDFVDQIGREAPGLWAVETIHKQIIHAPQSCIKRLTVTAL